MLSYRFYHRVRENLSKRTWRFLFGSNFRKLGRNSWIIAPRKIIGACHMTLGDDVYIQDRAYLIASKIGGDEPVLSFGKGVVAGHDLHVTSVRSVRIGDDVLIADRVFITDNAHGYEDPAIAIHRQPLQFQGEVVIGDGSWLGENVCILSARVGRHCVIGANSVVTRDIPDLCVAVGAPAKILRRYNAATRGWEVPV